MTTKYEYVVVVLVPRIYMSQYICNIYLRYLIPGVRYDDSRSFTIGNGAASKRDSAKRSSCLSPVMTPTRTSMSACGSRISASHVHPHLFPSLSFSRVTSGCDAVQPSIGTYVGTIMR